MCVTLHEPETQAPVWLDARPVLRFMTAGDVDDGKSTLIGRLLYESKALTRDQIAGARGRDAGEETPDFARLLDGLEAEAEQGITIDVAYRYFATPGRKFIIADAPGHEQYTRNMVTAASGSDLAVVLIDAARATEGLSRQTRRHLAIAALTGLDVIVAVNKMDLVQFSRVRFEAIAGFANEEARRLGLARILCLPLAAKGGGNVTERGPGLSWWAGPTLIEALEAAPTRVRADGAPLRLPVQRVVRLDGSTAAPFRGFAGSVESGTLTIGDEIVAASSAERARVRGILNLGRAVQKARAGDAVTVTLDREIDAARGETLTGPGAATTRGLVADLCWLADRDWSPARRLLLRQGTLNTQAGVQVMETRADLGGGQGIKKNDIARARVTTRDAVLADAYDALPATGGFILIDALTNETAAAGFIRAAFDPDEDLLTGDGI
jgi:sulfate adenylyltransferase subunit 1